MSNIRNRVTEMMLVPGRELLDNAGNWRVHPQFQQEAMDGILEEVGVADALKAYYSQRNGGELTLVDGHLRSNRHPDLQWPVLILDIDDEEADILLTHYDSIGQWATPDADKLDTLLNRIREGNPRLAAAKERIRDGIADQVAIRRRLEEQEERGEEQEKPGDELHRRLSEAAEQSVKMVVPIGDELGTVEQALKRTGLTNRGAALVAICNFFLDNVKADTGG